MKRHGWDAAVARFALFALLAGCSAPETDAAAPPPKAPIATAVLRASEIRIADRPEIEISITTAPGWRVRPSEPPAALVGFEILEWRALPVVRDAQREVHRRRVRLRALNVGDFVWPALSLEVAAPDGARTTLALPPIPLRVDSVRGEYPGRSAPFGARPVPEPPAAPRASLRNVAAAGAALALALAALLLVARRRARRVHDSGPAPIAPWIAALRELDRAAEPSRDAIEAGHRVAATLRRYVDRRFGAQTRRRTTEEVAVSTPPYAATSRWPTLVELLRDLDALRFRPAGSGPDATRRDALGSALARARAFVDATTPPEGLR
jgi:hypothetical protein